MGQEENAWAFNTRISQPVVHEAMRPGETKSGTIEVENQGQTPVQIAIYLQDWEYMEGGSGDKLFSAPGSSPWSASNWISYYPKQMDLPGQGKGVVDYTIRVPESALGGHYAVIFFEAELGRGAADKNGVSVQYTGRLGSLFEVEVEGTVQRSGEVTDLTIGRPDEDRPLTLSYSFLNTGNVALRPKAYFNVVDATGRFFGRGELNPLYTFPGRSGSTKSEWTGDLPPGDYTLLVTVDLGDNNVLVAEQPLSVARQLAIEGVRFQKGGLTAELTVYNAGNFQETCQGLLALENDAGTSLGSWPVETLSLAPNERRKVIVHSRSLSAGSYQCRIQMACGERTIEQILPCEVR